MLTSTHVHQGQPTFMSFIKVEVNENFKPHLLVHSEFSGLTVQQSTGNALMVTKYLPARIMYYILNKWWWTHNYHFRVIF